MQRWEKEKREKIEKVLAETDDEPTQIDQIAKIRGWFTPTYNSFFYEAVQEYVCGSADLETTLAKITKPIDESLVAGKDDFELDNLWNPVLHSAKKIPFRDADQHTKLVDLVKALKEHPEPTSNPEQSPYKGLSGLSMQARESYNDCPRREIGSFLPEIHAWTNFNYFLARLTDDGVFTTWVYIIWAMREALERTPQEPSSWHFDAHVPAAAVWVLVLGKKIYEREEDLTPKDKKFGNPAMGGDLWTGGPVFGKERWDFWKKRFGEVVGHEGVSEETKIIAKEAVEAMHKAETS